MVILHHVGGHTICSFECVVPGGGGVLEKSWESGKLQLHDTATVLGSWWGCGSSSPALPSSY